MSSQLIPYISEVSSKLKGFANKLQERNRTHAPNFNPLDFCRIDENKVSEILAFFLDPGENHGQGDEFLKIFLNRIELPYPFEPLEPINVVTERATDGGRRIDIVISQGGNGYTIGIENKIELGTADQQNQIADYLNYLDKISPNKYCLLYLSPKNKLLASHSIADHERDLHLTRGTLKLINYEQHIIDCISDFIQCCAASNVNAFLNAFQIKLKKKYMNDKIMDEESILIDYAMENNEHLKTLFTISQNFKSIKKALMQKLLEQFTELAEELKVRHEGLNFYPEGWSHYYIRFNYEAGGVLYGICRNKEDKAKPRLPEIEIKTGGDWKVSYWWPMYKYFYSNIDNASDFWMDINNGKAKEKARAFVKIVLDNFSNGSY